MNNTSSHIYEMRDNNFCIYIYIHYIIVTQCNSVYKVYVLFSKIQLQWTSSVLTTVFHP